MFGTQSSAAWFFIYVLTSYTVSANSSTTPFPDSTWSSAPVQSLSQEDSENPGESFVRRLEREAQMVSQQHLTQPQVIVAVSPPEMNNSPGFMHGYLTNTGAGNRQVTGILDVVETAHLAGSPQGVRSWDSIRFNNSYYLLATTPTGCTLWTLEPGLEEPLDLSTPVSNVIFTDGSVVRCQFYSNMKQLKDTLIFALHTRDPSGQTMDLYEVFGGQTQNLIHRSAPDVLHLDYLHLGDRNILVSALDGEFGWTFEKTSKFLSGILKISYPGLVANTLFAVDGRGFFAVANSTTCLLIQHDDDHLEVFDSIYLEHLVSLSTFEYQTSRFLLVAARNVQRIYLWHPDGLLFQQQLSATDVTDTYVAYHQHCQEDVFLVLAGEGPLKVFLWNGHAFDTDKGVIVNFILPDPHSLSFLDSNERLIILAVEKGLSRSIAVETSKSQVKNPVVNEGLRKTAEMNLVETLLRDQEFRSQNAWEVLSNAVQLGEGPLTFVAKQTVTNLKVSEVVESDFLLSELRHLSWEGSPLTPDDLKWTLDDLERMVTNLEHTMDMLEQKMKDVVLLNESTSLTGHKTVLGSVAAPSALVTHLSLVEAGQRNVDQIMQHVYRLNDSRVISGKKIFKGSLHITGDATFSRVNEVSLNTDVLLTSRPQHITGHWTFVSPLEVHGDVAMDGRLNGIRVAEDLVSLQTSTSVHNIKTFKDNVYVKEALVTPRLDGVQMEDLFLNSLTRTHSQVIHVLPPVLLEYVASRITELIVKGSVNGLDMSWLGHAVARSDRPAQFTGHKTFIDASFDGGMVVLARYDGVHLPFDLFGHTADQEVTGTKHFERVRVKNSLVHGLVNEMKLERDAMTLTGDQEIFDKVFSSGITVEGDLFFGGRIDGATDEDLESILTEPMNGTSVNVVFMQPVFVEKGLVIKKVVGIDLEALEKDLVFPEDLQVVFTGEKSFSDIKAPRIELTGRVNRYDIKNDFVTVDTDQVVKGTKTFIRPVHFGNSVQAGFVDGVDLVKIYNDHISLSAPTRPFQGPRTVVREMRVEGDLYVSGSVNGMDLGSSLLLSDSPSFHLSGKVFQGGLTVAGQVELFGGDLNVGHLDGVPMEDFVQRRVTLSTDQSLDRTLVVSGCRATSVSAHLVNNVDLLQFQSDVMRLSQPQLVTGHKTFTGPVIISGNVKVLDTVNGYDLKQLDNLAVRLDRPIKFDHHVTLEDDLKITDDLIVRGQINGVKLDRLASFSLRKSSPLDLTGINTFVSRIEVRGNVVAGKINGKRLDTDLLLNHGDQEITGTYTFGTVRAGELTLNGHLNEVDIVQLNIQTAKTNVPSTFLSDLALSGGVVVLEDTKVLGLINGLSLEKLAEDAVRKESPDTQLIRGAKVFTLPAVVAQDAQLERFNGIPLTPFFQDVVFVDRAQQEIWSEKRFKTNFIVRSGLHAQRIPELTGYVDGVLLNSLVENTVFIDQPATITGDVHILDNSVIGVLSATGRLNEIMIQKEVLLLNSKEPQTIVGKKTFSAVSLEVSMDVTGRINGYRLPDLVQDTLLVHTSQTVIGTKTLANEITVLRPHYGLVNQIDLSKEVYSLTDDIQFHENVIFDQDVIFKNEVSLTGLVNDLDLTVLQEEALTTTGEQVVQPPFVMSEVTASNVLVEGDVSGINVDKLQKEVKDYHSGQSQVVATLRAQVGVLDAQVDALASVAVDAVAQLHGLLLVQQINMSGWVLESSTENVVFVDPLEPNHLHVWSWVDGNLQPGRVDSANHIQFIFHPGSDGTTTMSTLVSLANKYHSAELIVEGTTVKAEVGEDMVVFTRTIDEDSTTHKVSLPYTRATGVRLFSSGDSVQALISTGPDAFCHSGTVHLLVWPTSEPEPVPVQTFPGGDLDFGIFEVEGMQYLLLAGRDEGRLGQTVKVYKRGCACSDQPFTLLSRTLTPNLISVDLFSLDGFVHLVTANRTVVQIFRFAGLQGFLPQLAVRVAHALNVQAILVLNDLYLVVGQTPGLAHNLLFKATWNGSSLRNRNFIKWL